MLRVSADWSNHLQSPSLHMMFILTTLGYFKNRIALPCVS
jgi:hypothetical protein